MKKQLDYDKINDLLWKLKQVVLCEPEDETIVAMDKFIKFVKNRKGWVQDYDNEYT